MAVLEVFNVPYKELYTGFVEFKTVVDEHFSGNEQRRDQWTNPRRGWVLEFEKNSTASKALEDFFIRMKGRRKAFLFKWESKYGGDDTTYKVRFDTDKLEYNVLYYGYRTFRIAIVEVKGDE